MKSRFLPVLCCAAVLLLAVAGRWVYYIAFATTPYDEVGVAINSRLPGPVRLVACRRLWKRYGTDVRPPDGCQDFYTWAFHYDSRPHAEP